MSSRAFALSFLLLASSAQASVLYKCTDEGGHTTYTNNKGSYRNCQVVSRDAPSSAQASAPAKARLVSNPSPADFPRVSSDTQKSRDGDRRHILQQELAAEQKSLDEARKALAEQEAARTPVERQQPYKDRVAMHNRNLDALQRELAKLK